MRLRVVALVSVTLMVAGLGTVPGAAGKAKPCKRGTVKAKVGGRATCLPKRLVLPKPAKPAPGLAQLRGALDLTELGFKTRSGKRVAPMSKRVGRSWKTARPKRPSRRGSTRAVRGMRSQECRRRSARLAGRPWTALPCA